MGRSLRVSLVPLSYQHFPHRTLFALRTWPSSGKHPASNHLGKLVPIASLLERSLYSSGTAYPPSPVGGIGAADSTPGRLFSPLGFYSTLQPPARCNSASPTRIRPNFCQIDTKFHADQ